MAELKQCFDEIPGDEPAILVAPGLCNAKTDWQELAHELGNRMVVLRNPFHTGEIPFEANSIEQWRTYLHALIKKLGIQHAIGHSRGVNDLLSGDGVHDLQTLTLLGPPTNKNGIGKLLENVPTEKMVTGEMLERTLIVVNPEFSDTKQRNLLATHQAAYGKNFRMIMKKECPQKTSVPEKFLGLIGAKEYPPTLMIAGKQDPWVDQAVLEQSVAGKPEIDLVVLEDVGHYPHLSAPLKVGALIKEYQTTKLTSLAAT